MKTKTIKLFGIIMMLVMGMSFNACSSDDDDDDGGGASGSKGNLVGNWYYSEEDFEMLWVLSSNGKLKEIEREVYNGREYVEEYYGTWSYDDGELIIIYDDDEYQFYTVEWISSNKIELTDDEGEKEIMSRVSYSTFPESEVESTDYSKVISGHWMNIGTSDNIRETLSIDYKGTGTIHYYDLVDQDWGVTATGTYTLSKDILSIRYTNVEVVDSDYEPTTYHGFTDGKSKNVKYTILSCDGKMLILKNESGKTLSFKKY